MKYTPDVYTAPHSHAASFAVCWNAPAQLVEEVHQHGHVQVALGLIFPFRIRQYDEALAVGRYVECIPAERVCGYDRLVCPRPRFAWAERITLPRGIGGEGWA